MMAWYFSGGYSLVPRNIMCSKKWAKPDFPGSTSLREPVCTGICTETMLGNPVGTTMTFRPLGRVLSVAVKGRMSRRAGVGGWALLGMAMRGSEAAAVRAAGAAWG